MTDLNVCTIIGRLTRDAELKFTAAGMAIATFSIAVNRSVKKGEAWEDEASFFDVTLWNKLAESLAKHLTKGKQIAVVGSLRQDRWQDQEGKPRSKVVISAETVQLLGSPQAGQGSTQSAPAKDSHQEAQASAQDDGFEDDIPW